MKCRLVQCAISCAVVLLSLHDLSAARTRKPMVMVKMYDGNYNQTVFIRNKLKGARFQKREIEEAKRARALISKAEGIMRAAEDRASITPAMLSDFFADSVSLLQRTQKKPTKSRKQCHAYVTKQRGRRATQNEKAVIEAIVVEPEKPVVKEIEIVLSDHE